MELDHNDDLFEAFSDLDQEQRQKTKQNELLGKKRTRSTPKISKNINDILIEDNDKDKESKNEKYSKPTEIDVIINNKMMNKKEDEDLLLANSIDKIISTEERNDCNDKEESPENMGMIIESFELQGCLHENIREKKFKGKFSLAKDPKITPATKYPFKLDAFQERAILCLENRQSVLVAAHTSAGKTVVAQYAIAMALRDNQRVIYTSPIKALSNQKYRELAHEFKDVGLMTGDVTLNPTASCIVMTTEILRNMLYKGSEITREMAWVIFDEVHYMRDKERGVVWEETIILLSNKINYVFLSATIPNAREFAMWISRLKNQPCNVVYTDFRPVPLQHYIYTSHSEGIHLIVDSKGNFREENFNIVADTLQSQMDIEAVLEKKRNKKAKHRESDDIKKIVSLINSRGLNPAIIFSFSKKECEDKALSLIKMDLTTEEEKEAIQTIYTNAVQTLAEEDQGLDQITSMLSILKLGIGIHHGGMLPIVKECVELIFQEGLIKVLFSTETFSMGINMPAKTVVFTSIEKWDGEQHRCLGGGEYIQMSGRAGRRGIDDQGVVILMLTKHIDSNICKNILKGISDPLNSSFHLNYNQLVNLYRIEGLECEYILKRSFYQFQVERSIPFIKKELAKLYDEYTKLIISRDKEEIIETILNIRIQIEKFKEENRLIIVRPNNILPFCAPGRVVKILNWGYGIVVNFSGKSIEMTNEEKRSYYNTSSEMIEKIEGSTKLYVVDILVLIKDYVDINSKLLPAALDDENKRIGVVPFLLQALDSISPIKVNLPQNLKDPSNLRLAEAMLKTIIEKFNSCIPLMDPIDDMGIEDEDLNLNIEKIRSLEKKQWEIEQKTKVTDEENEKFKQKTELKKKIKAIIEKYYSTTKLVLQDELNSMKRVLRRLEFVKDDVITLKGQIACNISTGDELLLTEMLFNGTFNDLETKELAAMLTCFLDNESTSKGSNEDEFINKKEYKRLKDLHEKIKENAERIHDVLSDCKIEIDRDDYVDKFKDDFMIPIYEWSKGSKFNEIAVNSIYEGQLVRSIRRLDELIKQVADSAQQIGNFALKEKLEAASLSIRRGLPFAASLYLNN